MTWWQAACFGLVQGITEFLPVSSDGHLAVAGWVLGIGAASLTAVVFVHAGTLAATLFVFRRDIDVLLRHAVRPPPDQASDSRRELIGLVVASVPTALIGLALESSVEAWAQVPPIVGAGFLGTAAFLIWTRRGAGKGHTLSYPQYFLIGVAQGLAVLPGLSRSGSTIAVGMALGLTGPAAFRFSFLLSLPAVGGAIALKLLEPGAWAILTPESALAGAVALVSGCIALYSLRSVVMRGRFWVFSLYLVPLGLSLIGWGLLARH